MEWMLLPFKRYVQFSGRSRRKEYWMYTLLIVIISVVISIIERALGLSGSTATPGDVAVGANYGFGTNRGILSNIFFLATFLPSLAVAVRRLHDTDRSGWWVLLPLAPLVLGMILLFMGLFGGQSGLAMLGGVLLLVAFVTGILLIVWYCTKGTDGPNKYGPDPLDPSGTADLDEVFS